jgi:hypothetical protein
VVAQQSTHVPFLTTDHEAERLDELRHGLATPISGSAALSPQSIRRSDAASSNEFHTAVEGHCAAPGGCSAYGGCQGGCVSNLADIDDPHDLPAGDMSLGALLDQEIKRQEAARPLRLVGDVQCPDPQCRETMVFEPPHAAEPDTATPAWRGGHVCNRCGMELENEPEDAERFDDATGPFLAEDVIDPSRLSR